MHCTRPCVMDLGSTNGTFINVSSSHRMSNMLFKEVLVMLHNDFFDVFFPFLQDDRLEPQRYYELFEKDTIKFGNSR